MIALDVNLLAYPQCEDSPLKSLTRGKEEIYQNREEVEWRGECTF